MVLYNFCFLFEPEVPPKELLILDISYSRKVKKDYQKGTYEVGEAPGSKVGNARNFFFHTYGTNAFLVELGGINSLGISVIHPESSRAQKIVNRHRKAMRDILYENIGK